jgi:hypothetical protein
MDLVPIRASNPAENFNLLLDEHEFQEMHLERNCHSLASGNVVRSPFHDFVEQTALDTSVQDLSQSLEDRRRGPAADQFIRVAFGLVKGQSKPNRIEASTEEAARAIWI